MSGTPEIAIVECGTGNLHSIEKAVRRLANGAAVNLTSDPTEIGRADMVVFPGDGSFSHCIRQIDHMGLRDVLTRAAETKPFLGICIGMQLLFERSEEGGAEGLGVLPGEVLRFKSDKGLKVPHMGWNRLSQQAGSSLFEGINEGIRFYFIHSYHVSTNPDLVLASCEYGVSFPAVIGKGNLTAVQFHPEKSHHQGLRLLENFIRIHT